jgi:hypothetical protein
MFPTRTAVQMSPFGETQQIPVPADVSGLHGIPLAPQTQVQKIAASRNSQVVAIISHGFAPAPFLLMIVDGIHFTKLAEFTLSDETHFCFSDQILGTRSRLLLTDVLDFKWTNNEHRRVFEDLSSFLHPAQPCERLGLLTAIQVATIQAA